MGSHKDISQSRTEVGLSREREGLERQMDCKCCKQKRPKELGVITV